MNNKRKSYKDAKTTRGNNKSYGTKGKGRAKAKESLDSEESGDMLNPKGRNNNPNWYFLDAKVADQVSQLSFQQLADMPLRVLQARANPTTGVITTERIPLNTVSIMSVMLNPAPGVQFGEDYQSTSLLQRSGINMAGFRLYSKLSAYTGRKQDYGPQDVSTLILSIGELISTVEWLRRAFGVCYTMNMRNRAFPLRILEAMTLDGNDLFVNYSQYRTRFNAVITRLNQIPIPQNIAYFDKCATLYERIYTDQESDMAQVIVYNPATTWLLDETSYSGGTILKTASWCVGVAGGVISRLQTVGYLLGKVEDMVDRLMNSATFNVIYTDLLNLASKQSVPFWKFDYLIDGYVVYPEFNANASLMLHNAIITHVPTAPSLVTAAGVTPFNDVYPNPDKNALFYNPAFPWVSDHFPTLPHGEVVVDSTNPDPNVEDRIEMLKFTAAAAAVYKDSNHIWSINAALPDHYVTDLVLYPANSDKIDISSSYALKDTAEIPRAMMSQIDWAPILYTFAASGDTYVAAQRIHGDLNYYTSVDTSYLRKVVDFTGLALFDLR